MVFGVTEHSGAAEPGQRAALGATVRRVRSVEGMSLRTLASQLGVSPATMSAIETGRAPVTVERLHRLAALLGVSATALLRGEHWIETPVERGRGSWRGSADIELDPILEAAVVVLVRRGYAAASMRDIAAQAGLSVAGVYHHYPSKQSLLVALVDAAMSELRWRVLAARDEGSNALESFRLMVESLALFHATRADLAFIGASEMRALLEPERTRLNMLRNDVQHLLDEQIECCCALGEFTFPDPHTAGRAIVTMCASLPSWFRLDGDIGATQVAQRYAELATRMLR
jgi:AcrR family transcriptional regulator